MENLHPFTRAISGYELAAYSSGSKFRNGDTLMARITPCLENGKTAYVSILDDEEVGFGSTEYIVFRNIEGVTDRKFIYYFVSNPWFRNIAIKSMVGSSGRQRVQQSVLENLEINLPPLAEQKRIAAILGALDDKIELNRRINANLEEQAKALYYKIDLEGCNNLEFDLCEFAEINSGKSIKPQKSGLYPILGANGEIGRTDRFSTEGRLIYTGRVGTLGKIYRVENKKVYMSDNTLVIKPKIGYNFIYFTLKKMDLFSYNVGSTQPLIRQSDIKGIKIFFPTFEILQKFEQISDILFSQINKNNDQNTILATLRDALLPRLMSGEIMDRK